MAVIAEPDMLCQMDICERHGMIVSDFLKEQSGIRHGFFTREGGVSSGIYASLNCGFGSNDEAEQCAREPGARRRQAGHEPRGAGDGQAGSQQPRRRRGGVLAA